MEDPGFPSWGATYYFEKFLLKTTWKWKKNWTERGHERRAPPRSATELVSLLNVYLFVGQWLASTVVHSPFKSLWITSDQTSYILTGWSKGVLGTCAPGPISFIFMQFSAKILPNNRILFQIQGLAPSSAWEILGPPLTLLLNSIAQGGVCWGGWLPRVVFAQAGLSDTSPCVTESQTGIKTLPCRNCVADSKYNLSIRRSHLQSIHLLDCTLYHSPRHLDFFPLTIYYTWTIARTFKWTHNPLLNFSVHAKVGQIASVKAHTLYSTTHYSANSYRLVNLKCE